MKTQKGPVRQKEVLAEPFKEEAPGSVIDGDELAPVSSQFFQRGNGYALLVELACPFDKWAFT